MKKVIKFLRSQNIEVTNNGFITSELPDGFEGMELDDTICEISMNSKQNSCYAIINNKLEKIEI